MTIATPLSFGQLSVWRSIESTPREQWHEFNLGGVRDIPPGRTVAQLLDGLASIVEKHPGLRTTYDFGAAGGPVQIEHRKLPLPVEVAEMATTPAEAAALAGRMARRSLLLEHDPGWYGTLLTENGRPARLVVTVHHMTCDGWALNRFAEEVDVISGAAPEPLPPALSPAELAVLQRGEGFAARREAAARYWAKLIDGGLAYPFPPRVERETGEQRIMGSLDLDPAIGALATLGHQCGVLPPYILLALNALTVCALNDVAQCTITLMSSNRFEPRWQPILTSMNQAIPVNITVDPGQSFAAFAKRVHWLCLRAYPHSMFDVDDVALQAREMGKPLPDLEYMFNNLGADLHHVAPAAVALAPLAASWEPSPRSTGLKFFTIVSSARGWAMKMRVHPAYFAPERIVRALEGVGEALRLVSADSSTPAAGLLRLIRN